MKRKIIRIDEEACNGCGNCVTGCAEGALKIVDGKARLVREQFCDGFGDCIGVCPTGALTIEARESESFDVDATREHVLAQHGQEGLRRMDRAGAAHAAQPATAVPAGCPGMRMRSNPPGDNAGPRPVGGAGGQAIRSELGQWPVQLHLVQPGAPFFRDRELVVLSTCSPVACADVHWRFLRGRGVVVACPKLDRTEGYAEKLAAILRDTSIPALTVVRMDVPCCGGLTVLAERAVELSERKDLRFEEVTVGLTGDIIDTERIVRE